MEEHVVLLCLGGQFEFLQFLVELYPAPERLGFLVVNSRQQEGFFLET